MANEAALVEAVGRLNGARVLCVGDVVFDRFVYGGVERVSPEAPIPVLLRDRESCMLGGAGNVVRNLAALGTGCCFIGAVGDDLAGREIRDFLNREPGVEARLLVEGTRRTSVKTRFVAHGQQLLRVDDEVVAALGEEARDTLFATLRDRLDSVGAVVLSDYGKGLLDGVTRRVIEMARAAGRPVVVDPKGKDYGRYRGATLVTPNRKELHEGSGLPVETDAQIVAAARKIIETCGIEMVLATRSQDGMSLICAENSPGRGRVEHLRTEARQVFDVSGAGDTVVATLAAALAAGVDLLAAVQLSNLAAGIVVGKAGTAVAQAQELVTALRHREVAIGEDKIADLAQAKAMVERWRAQGLKVGFTNGCFDLLHPGHVSLLTQARAACDRLVVGLNSDSSVSRLKGPTRPVQHEGARATVLGSLASVDLVTIFAEDTPLQVIEALEPDVLVKGADYTVETVVGADVVLARGGRVVLADLVAGQSTTRLVGKMAAK